MKTYKFIKTLNEWYIDLPDYLAQGGSRGDLQMVDGADTMLDIMAEKKDAVILTVSEKAFDGGDRLILIEKCDPLMGGGYYLMKTYEGREVNQKMWLCKVVEFVFDKIPEKNFIRRETGN